MFEELRPPYRTIVADPPWRLTTGPRWASGGKSKPVPYSTMTTDEIAALPVDSLADDHSHLYLWTVNHYLEATYSIARCWGFSPSTLLTWCKPPHGLGPGGAYVPTTEFCLFARRGSLAPLSRVDTTWFALPRGSHSAKPPAFLEVGCG